MTQPHGVPLEQILARGGRDSAEVNVHPWMKGYAAVLKHRFFAVTDNNGLRIEGPTARYLHDHSPESWEHRIKR
jgi:hypothetical protein